MCKALSAWNSETNIAQFSAAAFFSCLYKCILQCWADVGVYSALHYAQIIFPANFTGRGVRNKGPIVWLDRARPANTCIPPSFLKQMLQHSRAVYPPPKVHLIRRACIALACNTFKGLGTCLLAKINLML